MSYAFTELPTMSLSIKAMKVMDIMDIPLLQKWMLGFFFLFQVEDSLKYIVSITMVLPEEVTVPYYVLFDVPNYDEISEENLDETFDEIHREMEASSEALEKGKKKFNLKIQLGFF